MRALDKLTYFGRFHHLHACMYPLIGGIVVDSGGMQSTSGMTVASTKVNLNGGVTFNDRLNVLDGGLVLDSGVATIHDGFTVHDSGLFVASTLHSTGGISVFDTFVKVTGGLTVSDGGK